MSDVERQIRYMVHVYTLRAAERSATFALWEAVALGLATGAVSVDDLADNWELDYISRDALAEHLAEHDARRASNRAAATRTRRLVDRS